MTDLVWLSRTTAGRSNKLPAVDGDFYTEWNTQITLRIRRTRFTYGGCLGIGWRPLRIWLRVDNEVKRSKYQ